MTNKYINEFGEIVKLLHAYTTENKYGDQLFFIECENGHRRSIWEDDFEKQFKPVTS